MMKRWLHACVQWFRRVFSTPRRYRAAVMGAVGLLCICAIAVGIRAGSIAAVSAEKRDLPIYNVQRDDKVLALSFDAAWGDEQTQELLDIFDTYGIKTTFFVVGEWVDKFPHQVKAIHDAGHEVMNHSDTHPYMTKLSNDAKRANLTACSDKIEAITGVRPILFRAPYGDYNNAVVAAARDCGMYTIQWNLDSLDWRDLTPAQMSARLIPKIQPGSILLFHNGGTHTPAALPGIIRTIQEDGYKIVKISELIYYDNYTINHAGTQIPGISVNP